MTTYASLKITPQAREALQRATLVMSGLMAKRLTMSDVLLAGMTVAERHADELRAELTTPKQEGTTDR